MNKNNLKSCLSHTQVGCIRRNDDQGEKPPDTSCNPSGVRTRADVDTLLHKCCQRKPQTVVEGELVDDSRYVLPGQSMLLFYATLGWRYARNQKHDDRHCDVGNDNTVPDLLAEWIHERKNVGIFFSRFFDHD